MGVAFETEATEPTAVSGETDGDALRRIVVPSGAARVPVAAFNASL